MEVRARKLVILFGLCLLLSSCGDMQTGVSYLMTGNTSDSSSSGATDYRSMARQDAINAGISADIYERQINQESGFNPNAVSSAGAIGIAQIMKSTADSWNVDPWNPVASLSVAAQHMAWYYSHYGNDYAKALACYNAGCGLLESAETRCGWNWKTCVPLETQGYISAIMG